MTAQSGVDFLTGSSNLSAIVKKYSRGLGEHYDTINWQYLEGISEDKLRILSEIEAADNAVLILNAYIYRRSSSTLTTDQERLPDYLHRNLKEKDPLPA